MKKKIFSLFIVLMLVTTHLSTVQAAGETDGIQVINFKFVKAKLDYVDYPLQQNYHQTKGTIEGIPTTTKTDFTITLGRIETDFSITPVFTKFIRAADIQADGMYSVDISELGTSDPGTLEHEYDKMHLDYDLIPEGQYYLYLDFPEQASDEFDTTTQLLRYISGKQRLNTPTRLTARLVDLILDSDFNSEIAVVSVNSYNQVGGNSSDRIMDIHPLTNSLGFRYTLDGNQHAFFQADEDLFAYLPQEYLDFLESELALGVIDDLDFSISLEFLHYNYQATPSRVKDGRYSMLGMFDDGSTMNFITRTDTLAMKYNELYHDALETATRDNILNLLQDLYNEYTGASDYPLELEYYHGNQFVISKDRITRAEILSLDEYSLVSDNNINVNSKKHRVKIVDLDGNARNDDSVLIQGGDFKNLSDDVFNDDFLRLYEGDYQVADRTSSGAFILGGKYLGNDVQNLNFTVQNSSTPYNEDVSDVAVIEIVVADRLAKPVIDPLEEGTEISGTGIAGEVVEIILEDGTSYTIDVTLDNKWSTTLPKPLLAGDVVKARHINFDHPELNSDYFEIEVTKKIVPEKETETEKEGTLPPTGVESTESIAVGIAILGLLFILFSRYWKRSRH